MSRIIIILITLFTAGSLFPQRVIKGIVVDEGNGTPLSGVTITAASVTAGNISTESDADGKFSVEITSTGIYILEFYYEGYEKSRKEIVVDEEILLMYLEAVRMKAVVLKMDKPEEPDSNEFIKDTLNLNNAIYETDVIDVESELPVLTTEDEKKVFNVENLVSTTGGTALDVLSKLPMIEVDINDNISLRGTKNVLILIDNKPMKFASLRQIPAESVSKVEIITNPSAKYEAEGVTGIINVVMKKVNQDISGFNGNLYAGLRSNDGYFGFVVLNAKVSKWSFFGNGGAGIFNFNTEYNTHTDYYTPVFYFRGDNDGKGKSKYGYISAGIEHEINKNFNFGFDSYISLNKFDNSGVNRNYNLNSENIITSSSTFNSNNTGDFDNYTLSSYFNGIFDELGKEFNFDITYVNGNDANEEKQNYRYYDTIGAINPRLSNLLTVADDKSYNLKIQADYTHPFNGETRFETGYKGIFRENDNDYRYDTLNFNTNKYITNSLLTNHFNLSENINAVYGTFSQTISDFRFKLGLRLEHTLTKGELITDKTDFKKDYLSLFPTVSLSQRIGLQNEFQFSYSRRITRPMIYRLNPFVDKSNSRFIFFGNPELDPEFTDSYELGHSFYSEYITVNTSLYFRRSYDVISAYSFQLDSVTTATTYRNAAGAKTFGADLIISSKISEWWNVNGNFSLYNTSFEGSVISDYATEEGTGWRGNIRSTFSVSNLFDIEIYYNYTGRRINATGFNEPSQHLDIGIRRSFFDRKLSVSLRAEDIFKTKKWQGEFSGTGFTNYYTSKWDSRLFNLSISYRFGNTDKYYSKSKKTKANENEQEDVKEGN